jgi:hypothetical protein
MEAMAIMTIPEQPINVRVQVSGVHDAQQFIRSTDEVKHAVSSAIAQAQRSL